MSLSTQPSLCYDCIHRTAWVVGPSTQLEVLGQGPTFWERCCSFISFIFQEQFQDELAKKQERGRLRGFKELLILWNYIKIISPWEEFKKVNKKKQEGKGQREKSREEHSRKKWQEAKREKYDISGKLSNFKQEWQGTNIHLTLEDPT